VYTAKYRTHKEVIIAIIVIQEEWITEEKDKALIKEDIPRPRNLIILIDAVLMTIRPNIESLVLMVIRNESNGAFKGHEMSRIVIRLEPLYT